MNICICEHTDALLHLLSTWNTSKIKKTNIDAYFNRARPNVNILYFDYIL